MYSHPLVALVLLTSGPALASTYYMAPDGSDLATGTIDAPWATVQYAQTVVAAGDTVYFRGGRYAFTTAVNTCAGNTAATVDSILLSKSGDPGNPINYWAYPGERPVFDFSGVTDMGNYNCRHTGIRVTGSWLHLKGLELTGVLQLNNLNHESWCVYVIGGSNNLFEQLDAHHNMGPGFFVQRGSNNTFLNCDSHENEDTLTSNGDGQSADGFGCHPNQVGNTGNLFTGCRAWWNSDDGWDFINATEACTVENSWSWYNGYKPDAISGGKPVSLPSGNGSGFKGGGYGLPPTKVPANIPLHVIRKNLAFYNKASGIYANHSPVSVYFYNNTSYNNGVGFDLLGVAGDGTTSTSVGILRNNLAFGGTLTTNGALGGGLLDDQYNSWDSNLGVSVSGADFQSLEFSPPASCPQTYAPGGAVCVPPTDTTSFAGMASARQSDGSLPVLPFLRLAPGSGLIDKGVDVGLSFAGTAPDLGAFETIRAAGGAPSSGGASSSGGSTAGLGGVSGSGGSATMNGGSPSGGESATGTGGSPSGGESAAATGGTPSSGGQATGGSAGAGGTLGIETTGGGAATGGTLTASGGTLQELGGASSSGGAEASGGTVATGGATAVAGASSSGGKATGGVSASGGYATGGNSEATAGSFAAGGTGTQSAGGTTQSATSGTLGGGETYSGGAPANGGAFATGGTFTALTDATTAGTSNVATNDGATTTGGGCDCRVASIGSLPARRSGVLALMVLVGVALLRRRRAPL